MEPNDSRAYDVFIAVLRNRRLVGLVLATGLGTAVAYTWFSSPVYQATAKLMVTSDRARIAVSPDANSKALVEPVTDADLYSEVALLKSVGLVREALAPRRAAVEQREQGFGAAVSSALRLPFKLPGRIYAAMHGVPPGSPFEDLVQDTAERVEVIPITHSNLIEVSYDDTNPERAAAVVNALVNAHVERHVRFNQQTDAQRFFEQQRTIQGDKLSSAETTLRAFYDREGIDSVPQQQAALRTRLNKLELSQGTATTDFAEATARADFLEKALRAYPKNMPPEAQVAGSSSLQLIKTRVLELELQRSQMLATYAPTSIKMRELDRQLEEARRLLASEQHNGGGSIGAANPTYQTLELSLAQARSQVAAIEAKRTALDTQIAEQRTKLDHLDRIGSELQRLEQEVASAKESFQTYLRKEEEARFSNALDESHFVNVEVVEKADVPLVPTS